MAIINKTAVALLSLRLSVFLVMLMWTIDKFVNPGHAIRVYDHFYHITGLGNVMVYLIGAIELVILFCFVTGIKNALQLRRCAGISCRIHTLLAEDISVTL